MIALNGHKITPTIFPDKTSQVWKINDEILNQVYRADHAAVVWEFESEGELVHLAQLKELLDTYCSTAKLTMPYLPYGRQDKRTDNHSTFGLTAFARLINVLGFCEVEVLDAHNNARAHRIKNLTDRSPRNFISDAYRESKSNLILFPDEGANKRYSAYKIGPGIYAEKRRDQATGAIIGASVPRPVKGKRVLIVDDICDGGATFVLMAAILKKGGAKSVSLYVTHGIFSKGTGVLREAGIDRIFTRKGEIK